MAVSQEYRRHIEDLLAPLGAVSTRRMFGGASVFYRGTMFALIIGDELYFRVDDGSRPEFLARGAPPFSYKTARGVRVVASYYRLPEEIMDSEAEMLLWGRRAVEAALQAAAKPKRRRRAS